MMNEKKFYKMIAFDLDTKKLKLIYKKGHYTNAYYELAHFFKNHHFTEHNQGFCYVSDIKMARSEVVNILSKAKKEMPWLKYCAKNFKRGDMVSPNFDDMTDFMQNGSNEQEFNKMIKEAQEARRQKQLAALKNFKIDNKQIIQSKDKER